MSSITYAITCCNELTELTTLLNFLQLRIREEDEIVIQYDSDSVTPEVLDYITLMAEIHSNHTVVGFPLKGDFSSFKNNLKKHSTKDYIFQLDADEIPHEYLVEVLGDLLESNPVDVIFVPRINTIAGLTDEHVTKWGWKITKLESDTLIREKEMDTESEEYKLLKKYDLIIEEKVGATQIVKIKYYLPVNNMPDYQTRIYKRTDDVMWMNKVHERITGYNNFSNFPMDEQWCMYHHKSIVKQSQQNDFYETL